MGARGLSLRMPFAAVAARLSPGRAGTGRTAARSVALAAAVLAAAGASATPNVGRAPFGTAADGQVVELLTLHNDHGMTVRISTRGGAIIGLEAPDRKGRPGNVVLGHPDFAAWEKAGGFNTIIGRFANRISGGGFTLDGTFYPLPGNPTTKVTLHSGPGGLAGRLWQPEPFSRADRAGVVLRYVSPDGETGLPGEMHLAVTYTLTNANVLRIEYEATTTKPTVINLTNHTYFNLGGDTWGPVYDETLQIMADRMTPTDARLIPTGELKSVAGTPFDFRQPARIGDRVNSSDPQMLLGRGFDHNFVLAAPSPPGGAPVIAARLRDARTGRQLEVRTTEPAVQVYSGNGFNGASLGGAGRTLRQGDGVTLETQHFPDSPNQPAFPSTVLRPGQTFHSITEWAFSTFP